MLSVQQSYSRPCLFRPWDVSESKNNVMEQTNIDISDRTSMSNEPKTKKKKLDDNKRENRLRKIRGTFKKSKSELNVHQDDTVSTTTEDANEKKEKKELSNSETSDSPVASLSMCCDRLLQEPGKKSEDKPKESVSKSSHITESFYAASPVLHQSLPLNMYPSNSGLMPEYLPTADIAHALGVPPSDPLLLESLAQGYAMELEYARILQQENEAKLLNARKQRPKKYKCPHCHVGFSNNGQLKGHIRIHTGERPYKCDEKNCGKTFTRNEELTRHKRIHSGVRPFPCPHCGKKFGRRDHLKKHTRTHFLQAERMMPVFVPLSAMPHVGGFPYLYGY